MPVVPGKRAPGRLAAAAAQKKEKQETPVRQQEKNLLHLFPGTRIMYHLTKV
ncbi:hypothetical protein [Nitrososphaera sp.]|uniref:hypothetical protein n=1 Tax=Nitrososphaera sp. TaxID=1971748 RepID=UPI00307D660A